MSQPNNESESEKPKQPIITKGMYLTELYNKFKKVIQDDTELKEFYELFELLDNIEDVVYMVSLTFPGNITETKLKTIINGYGMSISETKFKEFYPIFLDFLEQFKAV